MKNSFLLPLAISVIFAATFSFAEDIVKEDIYKPQFKAKFSLKTEDAIEIGVQTYWYKYEEEVDGSFFMSTTGQKYGLSLTGIKNVGSNVYVVGDIRYATGDVEYESASGKGDVSDYMYEGRLLIGVEKISDGILLSSFIGLGYRYLFNDLRDLGSGGYRRESQYVYVPIGLTHRFRANRQARISTTLEYDYFVQGEQKSYLSDVGPAYAAVFGDPVNDQNDGYGIRFSTNYEEENWSAGIFFNYWKIEDSETNYYIDAPFIYSLVEPKNDTKEIGVQFKYRF
jgi:hypothetical protein